MSLPLFVILDEVDDDFVKIPYVIDTMVAVLPITHPLAKQKTIPLRMLADENFLLHCKTDHAVQALHEGL